MIYQNETILMRPFERRDMSEKYRSWFNDPVVTRYNTHGLFAYTPEKMERFIKNIEEGGPDIIWGIFKNNGSDHIGNCSIQSINWIYRSCEIAFVIGDTRSWGLGIGTMVGRFMLEHAFDKLGMNRVWTGTAATNHGMNTVAARLGMKCEGVSRQGMYLSGEFVDVNHYGILREEYYEKFKL